MPKQTLTADKILTEKQAKLMLKEIGREKDNAVAGSRDVKYINDYFLIAIAYYSGLRISEMSDLRWADAQPDYLIVRKGKGRKSRSVVLGSHSLRFLSEFREVQLNRLGRSCEGSDYLFLGQRGKLGRTGIHLRFKYWLKRLNLASGLSFHSLRHGYATRLLDNGIPLASVRDQLGHSNVSITSAYLHFTEEARERLKKIV
ncbi:MAG: tyrosine-type recombinase/integrase [Oligoflexus sp.]